MSELRDDRRVNGARGPELPVLTLGAGKKRPGGRRNVVADTQALAKVLREHGGQDVAHAWWSPHVWTGDARDRDEWEAACAVVLDLDGAGHTIVPPDVAERLAEAVAGGLMPGNLYHRTPAGARLVFMLEHPCDDRAAYARAAIGAATAATAVLCELDIPLRVDPAVSTDLARMVYAPNCAAKGKHRTADVIVLRDEPYALATLHEWAEDAPPAAPASPAAAAPSRGTGDVLPVLKARGLYKADLGGGKHDVTCPWKNEHTGASDSGSAYYEPSPANGGAGGFKCQHAHCASRTIGDLRRALGPGLATLNLGACLGAEEARLELGGEDPLAYLRSAYQRLSIDDLTTDPPPQRFIVRPYIPERTVFVLAGAGASNKTTLTTYIAVCRALGRPLWGDIEVAEGETIIVSTEDRIIDYRRKLAALRVELGDDFDARAISERVHFLDLTGVPVRLVDNDHGQYFPTPLAEHLAQLLAEKAPAADLVFMETLSRLAGGVETNDSLSIAVEAAQRIARLHPVAVGLIHHSSQNSGKDGDTSVYAVRGGTALVDNARSVLVLQKLTRDVAKALLPEADISDDELERPRVLAHAKSNVSIAAKPLLLERVGRPHGPVLRPAALRERAKAAQANAQAALLEALCATVERLQASGIEATRRGLRDYASAIGCGEKAIPSLVLLAAEKNLLSESEKTVRGGGHPLILAAGWRTLLTACSDPPESSQAVEP